MQNAELTVGLRRQDVDNLQVKAGVQGLVMAVGAQKGGGRGQWRRAAHGVGRRGAHLHGERAPKRPAVLRGGAAGSRVDHGGKVYTGAVLAIGQTASGGNVPVVVSLPSGSNVRPGMAGTAMVELADFRVMAPGAVTSDLHEVRVKVGGTVADLKVAEGARVTRDTVVAQLANESLLYQLALAENDLLVQQQSLDALRDPASDPDTNVASLRQKVDQAVLTLSTRQEDVDNLTVTAPVSGTISALAATVGDRVSVNQNLFRVADYNLMQVVITVDELDIARVKPGARASITLDALPGATYQGQVLKVNPEGIFRNEIANFEVTVSVANATGLLAGMNSNVEILVEEKSGVLWVPAQAVRVAQGRATVRTCEPAPVPEGAAAQRGRAVGAVVAARAGQCDPEKQPQMVEVQIGARTGTQVEIVSGLAEGQLVVTTEVTAASQQGGFGGGPFGGGGGAFPGGGRR